MGGFGEEGRSVRGAKLVSHAAAQYYCPCMHSHAVPACTLMLFLNCTHELHTCTAHACAITRSPCMCLRCHCSPCTCPHCHPLTLHVPTLPPALPLSACLRCHLLSPLRVQLSCHPPSSFARACAATCAPHFVRAAELLGVDRDALVHALTTRTRQTPEGPIVSPLDVKAAVENRDSLAKILYSKVRGQGARVHDCVCVFAHVLVARVCVCHPNVLQFAVNVFPCS